MTLPSRRSACSGGGLRTLVAEIPAPEPVSPGQLHPYWATRLFASSPCVSKFKPSTTKRASFPKALCTALSPTASGRFKAVELFRDIEDDFAGLGRTEFTTGFLRSSVVAWMSGASSPTFTPPVEFRGARAEVQGLVGARADAPGISGTVIIWNILRGFLRVKRNLSS